MHHHLAQLHRDLSAPSGSVRTPAEVESLGRILSVWAHPDDETYLAGGILAAAADAGRSPVVVTATAGELGFADPTEWPPERAAAVRVRESRAAMAVLGVDDHWWLGYEDGACAIADVEVAARRLATIVDDLRPDTVLTFGPDGVTGHPDHCAVSTWVTRAVEIAHHRPRLMYACAEQRHRDQFRELDARLGTIMAGDGPLTVAADDLPVLLQLGGRLLDRKVTALRAMASQTAGIVALLGERTYADWVAVEAFVDATTVGARTRRATS